MARPRRIEDMNLMKIVAMGLLSAGMTACAVGGESEAPVADSLLEVQIPEDFTFATSRGLTVRATGDASVIAETLAEVRLADGELVHRGPLTSAIELAVPTAAERLSITLRSARGERTLEVPVAGPEAVIAVD
jgi:hypothetical protein